MSLLVVQYSFDEDGLLSRVTAASGGENWEEMIVRDSEGLKIEKIFSGGIRMTRTYDAYGNVISQKSRSLRQDGYDRRYAWNASGRLQSVIDGITGGRTTYAYDAVSSLMSARYEDGTDDYRMPDAAGNVFRSRDRRDREYGNGGRILHDRHYDYLYDVEGNLILKTPRRGLTQHPNHEVSEESDTHIAWQTGDYAYEWYGNGMLKEVRLPYGKTVRFEYDALGRRTAKLFNGHVFRYLWDGNVMVQEWQYEEKDRSQHSIDEFGRIRMLGEEPVENLVTWVYEEGSYVPVAKLQNGERYTIISDYMGRPVEAYNSYGNVVWQADYDVYGDLRNIKGIRDFIPFRQLGQYEDEETGLYYNRFRYYDPNTGTYISKDPIIRSLINIYTQCVNKIMERVQRILKAISESKDCLLLKREHHVNVDVGYLLPDDLRYYLENYNSIIFWENSEYSVKIVGIEDFKKANPVIIGEEVPDDISNNWFIIADDNPQFITIDLFKERLGKCYDSFWDRYGVVGEQPIIANSFTELLEQLFKGKGGYYYWLQDNFEYIGDAYDNLS